MHFSALASLTGVLRAGALRYAVRVPFSPSDLGVGLDALATLPWQQLYTVNQTVSRPLSWPGWPHWWLHWEWRTFGSDSAVEGGRRKDGGVRVCPKYKLCARARVCVCACLCVCTYILCTYVYA